MASHDYSSTLGALLVGAVGSIFLSGILATQVVMYMKWYPKDLTSRKILVALVWLLDLSHSAMVFSANWFYLIQNFSNTEAPKEITWSVDVSIALTALTTFVVHGFFTLRVYKLSNHNLWFVSVIALLVVLRVVSAFSCVANMARMKTWDSFRDDSAWLFTTGLSISAAADVLIAVSLIFLLRQSRTGWKTMDNLINSIVVYTIENGLLTSIFAILSLVCWVTMSHNLIFLALHFTISKLYANSFLATLNTRKQLLQRSHPSGQRLSVLFPSHRVDLNRNPDNGLESIMQISVEKTIHRVTDNEANPTSPVLPVRFNTPDTRTDDSSSGSKGSQKGRRPQL